MFAVNSVDEYGNPTSNPWAYNFGLEREEIVPTNEYINAVFNGNHVVFGVDEDGSSVTLTLDLTNFDFTTNQGAKIKIGVFSPDSTYTVSLQFFLECYSLEVSERNDNTLTVVTSKGEQSFSFHTDELEKEKDDYSEEYIGKTSFTVSEKDMENGVSVTASWPFRGTYSEKDIPEIKAAGVIKAE